MAYLALVSIVILAQEIIQDGFNGILVDPNEKELGLSNAIDKIIVNQELRLNLSKKFYPVKKKIFN